MDGSMMETKKRTFIRRICQTRMMISETSGNTLWKRTNKRGSPRKVLARLRGRPKKLFHLLKLSQEEQTQIVFLVEISLREAVHGSEAEDQYSAMALELKSIIKNDTWKLVKRPENRDVIGNRIVLRNKYDCNRVLERRKARIITKSFSY